MPNIYEDAIAFRNALLSGERTAALRLIDSYGDVWKAIRLLLEVLTDRITEARDAGETISPAWLFQEERYRTLLQQSEEQILAWLQITAAPSITGSQRGAVTSGMQDAAALIRGSGVDVSFVQLPTRAIEQSVAFLSDGSTLSQHLATIAPKAVDGIRKALIVGVATGQGARDIARGVRQASGMPLDRALTISRTETMRSYREATLETYQENDDVIKGWTWLASLSSRTCPMCLAMNGTFHPLTEQMHSHPRCRCCMSPVTKTYAELGIDAPEPERPSIPTGDEWLKGQKRSVQEDVLGKDGAAAWRAGNVSLSDFIGTKDSDKWGPSRYSRSLKDALTAAS